MTQPQHPSTPRSDGSTLARAGCRLETHFSAFVAKSDNLAPFGVDPASDALPRIAAVAKAAVQHACSECGYATGKWLGRCPACGGWGTLVEERTRASAAGAARARPLLRLVDVEASDAERLPTGVAELDRVLGGGLVPASLVLVSGDPGIGKSTLLLMALRAMSAERAVVLVTGEESAAQVKLRADRLGGAADVQVLAETNLDEVCATLERERPDACVIDSVQTLFAPELGSAPGSVAQVREAAGRLLRVAKEHGVATFLVGHVTKEGSVAGPRVLEHLVDCVLHFEGDRYRSHRVLRAVKNRFGSTNELGVFEMTSAGLVAVEDPSEIFGRAEDEPGADLGVALAIASAARSRRVHSGIACFGEVGLTGRLRPVSQAERRLAECAKLGFARALVPDGTESHGRIALAAAGTLRQAIETGLDADGSSKG